MSLLLQISSDSDEHVVGLEDFARVGSSPECDIVIDDAHVSEHALTITVHSPRSCKVYVKGGNVRVDGRELSEGAAFEFAVGQAIELAGTTLRIAEARQRPAAKVVAPVARREVTAEAEPAPRSSPQSAKSRPRPAQAPQVAQPAKPKAKMGFFSIFFTALLIVAAGFGAVILSRQQFGKPAAPATAPPDRPTTITEMIGRLHEKPSSTDPGGSAGSTPLAGVPRSEVIVTLQRVGQQELMGRNAEARAELLALRDRILESLPPGDRGRAVLYGPSGKGPSSTAADGPLFRDEKAAQLFEFVVDKATELGMKSK